MQDKKKIEKEIVSRAILVNTFMRMTWKIAAYLKRKGGKELPKT